FFPQSDVFGAPEKLDLNSQSARTFTPVTTCAAGDFRTSAVADVTEATWPISLPSVVYRNVPGTTCVSNVVLTPVTAALFAVVVTVPFRVCEYAAAFAIDTFSVLPSTPGYFAAAIPTAP